MAISLEEKLAFLKQRQMFKDLDDGDILSIANRMKEHAVEGNKLVFAHGESGNAFYIIYQGSVRVWRKGEKKEIELAVLEEGDLFGEEALLLNIKRTASITSLEETIFLALVKNDFLWMLNKYPQIKAYLGKVVRSRQTSRRRRFEWLHEGEVVHLVNKRHPIRLWIDILKPLAIAFIAVFFLFFASLIPGFTMISQIIGVVLVALAVLWGIWEGVDYYNDYFILTNQRVVWVEQVLLQTASRREAPLAAIQSVDVQTSQLGRILGYGNVFVRTFTGTGSMTLTSIQQPKVFKGQIEELLMRVRQKSEEVVSERIRQSIRQGLGLEAGEIKDPVFRLEKPVEEHTRRFAILRTREVTGDIITYHKHWWVLLSKEWIPLVLIGLLVGLMIVGSMYQFQISGYELPMTSLFILWFMGLLVLIGIVGYHYLDWKNDIYKLTKDMVIDSEKKPLGQEVTKSAPIKNIISIEYQRKGLLRLILNFGLVNVVVADATLTFLDVHNPAQVQQDIYYRQEDLKMQATEAEIDEDRAHLTKWLQTYHEILENEQDQQRRPNND